VSRSQPSDAQGTRGRCNEGGDGGTVWALIGWIVTDVSCWSVHLLVCTVAVDWLLKIEHHVIEQALLQTRPVLTKPTRSILTKPLVPSPAQSVGLVHHTPYRSLKRRLKNSAPRQPAHGASSPARSGTATRKQYKRKCLFAMIEMLRTLSDINSAHRSIRIEPGDLHSDPQATIIVSAAVCRSAIINTVPC
jgi:hypothetical protein